MHYQATLSQATTASFTFLFCVILVLFFDRWVIGRVIEYQTILCLFYHVTVSTNIIEFVLLFSGLHVSVHLNFYKIQNHVQVMIIETSRKK